MSSRDANAAIDAQLPDAVVDTFLPLQAHVTVGVTGLPCQTVPGLNELLAGAFEKTQLRDVSIEDLLGREAVQIEEKRVAKGLEGRVVLVTGAAGSIGSELSRQVARFRPRRLVLLDQAESALFAIENELRKAREDLEIVPELADIREATGVSYVLISHDLAVVRQLTDQTIVMHQGRVVERGTTAQILDAPQEPYTRLLRDSVPRPGWKPQRRTAAVTG